MEPRIREEHFKAVVIEAGNWFSWQKGQRTAGTENRVHYLPTSALARRFVTDAVPYYFHFRNRFPVSDIEQTDCPEKGLRSQETTLNERKTKEDIDWITDWLAVEKIQAEITERS